MKFYIFFNKGKQSVKFHVEFTPEKFREKYECDAWYGNATRRKKRSGLFGHIHLPGSRGVDKSIYSELVTHEVYHLVDDWWRCRQGNEMTDNNEELRATIHGEIVRKFWRKMGV